MECAYLTFCHEIKLEANYYIIISSLLRFITFCVVLYYYTVVISLLCIITLAINTIYYKFFITYYYIMSRLIKIQNALPAPSVLW